MAKPFIANHFLLRYTSSHFMYFMTKKKHHFVPVAYLNHFCDEHGKIYVYRKDDPEKAHHLVPKNTGFHKYYYSQPLPDGGKEHNALEELFSGIEANWGAIVKKLLNREDINDFEHFYNFITLQYARVPRNRDVIEKILAEVVRTMLSKSTLKQREIENLNDIKISVDPHRSILLMGKAILGAEEVLNKVGLRILHNYTDNPFITSDNPVIWFDPFVAEEKMRPYTTNDGEICFLFPITPKLLIYGHSSFRSHFLVGLEHYAVEPKYIEKINKYICMFAYETIFAQNRGNESLIKKYADISPVPKVDTITVGKKKMNIFSMVFGMRTRKEKWEDS